jgi:hypothetical protein
MTPRGDFVDKDKPDRESYRGQYETIIVITRSEIMTIHSWKS